MWITESNRIQHVVGGTSAYMVCYLLSGNEFASLWASVVMASTAEAKDVQAGGKWDRLDFLATVFFPIILTILIFFIKKTSNVCK